MINIHNKWVQTGLAVLACFLWSTAFVGVKVGLQFAPPLLFAGIRFLLSGMLLIPFSGVFSFGVGRIVRHWKVLMVLGFLQTAVLYGLFFMGMTLIPGAVGAIVVGSSPLIAAVTAHVLTADDKLSFSSLASILLGVAGVVFISMNRGPLVASNAQHFLGISCLGVGAVFSALANLLVSRHKNNLSPMALNCGQFLLGGLMLILASFLVEGRPDIQLNPVFLVALSWLSALSAIGLSIWYILLKNARVSVSSLNMWKFIIPLSGAALSWLLLPGESPNAASIVGMVLVAGSVWLYFFQKGRTVNV